MTIAKAWVLYVITISILCYSFVWVTINDPDEISHPYTLTVLKIIQEDHKSSTNYHGVFKLDDGRVIDFNVTAKVFVQYQPGDKITFNLTNKELLNSNSSYEFYTLLIGILTMVFGVFGAFYILEILRPKVKKLNKN